MAIAKKIVTRVVGGITGKGKTNVNPVYRNEEKYIQQVRYKAETSTESYPSNLHPKLGYKVSENVKVVPSTEMKKNNAPFKRSPGAVQAIKENLQPTNTSKRGLKAANKTKPGSSGNSGKRNFKRGLTPPARPNRVRG